MAVIRKPRTTEKARRRELKKVIMNIKKERRVLKPNSDSLRWVKSHIRIKYNEEADKKMKLDAKEDEPKHMVIIKERLIEG